MKTSEKIINNPDKFWEELTNETELVIQLELEISGDPEFKININGSTVYDQIASEIIEIKYPYLDQTKISVDMWMHSKTDNDTVVDDQGNIISDKYIKIKKFMVNNFSLDKNFNFYHDKLKYYDQNNKEVRVEHGFWFNNHRLNLTFTQPFIHWYLEQSSGTNVNETMSYRKGLSADNVFYTLVKNLDLLD